MSPKRSRKKKQKSAAQPAAGQPYFRVIADNRRARFDYDILDRVEAGVALTGTEIKSVRAGRVNIRDSYAQARGREVWLHNLHIAPWETAGPWSHDPARSRKLLLHAEEIRKLAQAAGAKSLTIVPLRVYIRGHYAKVEIALAKGRRQYDKRQAIMRRETEREIARAIRRESD